MKLVQDKQEPGMLIHRATGLKTIQRVGEVWCHVVLGGDVAACFVACTSVCGLVVESTACTARKLL